MKQNAINEIFKQKYINVKVWSKGSNGSSQEISKISEDIRSKIGGISTFVVIFYSLSHGPYGMDHSEACLISIPTIMDTDLCVNGQNPSSYIL